MIHLITRKTRLVFSIIYAHSKWLGPSLWKGHEIEVVNKILYRWPRNITVQTRHSFVCKASLEKTPLKIKININSNCLFQFSFGENKSIYTHMLQKINCNFFHSTGRIKSKLYPKVKIALCINIKFLSSWEFFF